VCVFCRATAISLGCLVEVSKSRTVTVVGCPSFNPPEIQKLNTVFRKLYISVLIYKGGKAPLRLALDIELSLISGAIFINAS
jgi:hypothetical protein